MNTWIKPLLVSLVVLLNVGCDRISKEVVREKIEFKEVIEVLGQNFILTKIENTGAAMSLGESLHPNLKTVILQGIPLIVLLLLFRMIVIKNNYSMPMIFAFACIIGGGIGNIYDRILYGSVTDFMYMKLGVFQTGIFNMADVSITMGFIIMILSFIFGKKDELKII